MRDQFADISMEAKQKHFDQLNAYQDSLYEKPALRSLFIEMTLRCNEHCLHCGSSCGDVPTANTLTDQEIMHTLRILNLDMKRDGQPLPFLNITGGEPLLRPGLPQLMKHIHAMGYPWGMTSNGLLITKSMAQDLKDAGIYSIGISLDGMQESHEWFRSTPGSWEKALEAVDNLIAAGIEKVMITTVVTKRNINELDAVLEVVKAHKCPIWRIINVEPIGRALDHAELMLDAADYQYLYKYLAAHQDDPELAVITTCNHYVGLELERRVRPWYFFCRAGIQIASIQHNGDICACLDIERRPELVFGNVRRDRLYRVWKEGFGIYRTRKDAKSSKCRSCTHRENCRGNGWHTWNFDENEPRICMIEQLGDGGTILR